MIVQVHYKREGEGRVTDRKRERDIDREKEENADRETKTDLK